MSKFSNFVIGTIVGAAAGFVAGSLLISDEQIDDVKKKIKDNDALQLKDFDDIVIDDSKDKDDVASGDNAKNSVNDLNNAEKDDDTSVNTNSEA